MSSIENLAGWGGYYVPSAFGAGVLVKRVGAALFAFAE